MIHIQRLPSFQTVILVSIVLRIALILYSEWHDARSVVKYTDVDYRVFSDAARFILHPTSQNVARGPWSLAFEKYFGFQVGE
jgi:phosphatidylinositol glycan class M